MRKVGAELRVRSVCDSSAMPSLPIVEPVVINLDVIRKDPCRDIGGAVNWDPVDALIAALCEAEVAWADARMGVLDDLCRKMSADAEGMGMTTFAKVAAQASDLSKRNDPAALAASLARLVRVGEASLAAVWDLQDLRL